MEYFIIFAVCASLVGLVWATYLLVRGETQTAFQILGAIVIIWLLVYMLTNETRRRRRRRY